jgi:uncharacterized protein YggE
MSLEAPPGVRVSAATFGSWLVALTVAIAPVASAGAAAGDPRPPSWVEVAAEAEVEVRADVGLIDLGVVTQAPTAAAAARDNAERMQAVLARLRKTFGDRAELSTGTYGLRPLYANQRDAGEPRITGYQASNIVHVKTRELARVGDLVDAALQSGANQVQRIGFTLSDETGPREEALRKAAAKARREAGAIAAALDVKVTRFHSAVAHDAGVVRPVMREAMMARADGAASTPIEPGVIQVRARIVLTVETSP